MISVTNTGSTPFVDHVLRSGRTWQPGEKIAVPPLQAAVYASVGLKACAGRGNKLPALPEPRNGKGLRFALIQQAIGVLDKDNHEHFKQGEPTAAAVSAVLGFDVSLRDVSDAYQALVDELL